LHTTAFEYYTSIDSMPADAAALAEEYAFTYGRCFDSYQITEHNREYFFSSGRRGVVGFVRDGRYVHVLGGLLAEEDDRDPLLGEFVRFAQSRDFHVSVFNVCDDDHAVFRKHGFQLTKWGEEPLIHLPDTTWRGKKYEWLRRQENFCRRHDLTMREVTETMARNEDGDPTIAELLEISEAHIENTTHGKEMRVLVSEFDPPRLGRRRIFVAESPTRIEAYISCNPCLGGEMWAIETWRRRPDSPRGTVAFLMMQTMRLWKEEGVQDVSLCLVGCVRCEEPMPNDSRLLRNGMTMWWNYGNWLFDMRGLYHFKSRFRPEYRNLCVAALPNVTFHSMRTFMKMWKICRPELSGLVANVREKWGKRSQRKHLAKPTAKGNSNGKPPAKGQPSGANEKQVV
jgi:phosphatidylglycerol lysyltransferase